MQISGQHQHHDILTKIELFSKPIPKHIFQAVFRQQYFEISKYKTLKDDAGHFVFRNDGGCWSLCICSFPNALHCRRMQVTPGRHKSAADRRSLIRMRHDPTFPR